MINIKWKVCLFDKEKIKISQRYFTADAYAGIFLGTPNYLYILGLRGWKKPINIFIYLWARNSGIPFFSQNLPFFFHFPYNIQSHKIFYFLTQICPPPILFTICVAGFMQNFRTRGLIIKQVCNLFNLPDKYGKIIQCAKWLVILATNESIL